MVVDLATRFRKRPRCDVCDDSVSPSSKFDFNGYDLLCDDCLCPQCRLPLRAFGLTIVDNEYRPICGCDMRQAIESMLLELPRAGSPSTHLHQQMDGMSSRLEDMSTIHYATSEDGTWRHAENSDVESARTLTSPTPSSPFTKQKLQSGRRSGMADSTGSLSRVVWSDRRPVLDLNGSRTSLENIELTDAIINPQLTRKQFEAILARHDVQRLHQQRELEKAQAKLAEERVLQRKLRDKQRVADEAEHKARSTIRRQAEQEAQTSRKRAEADHKEAGMIHQYWVVLMSLISISLLNRATFPLTA